MLEGVCTIGVWESEQAWERFRAERLEPAIASLGGPLQPQPTFRDLHPAHVVVGRPLRTEPTDPNNARSEQK